MIRHVQFPVLLAACVAGMLSAPARAHFVFVVPDERGLAAALVFSETLEADPAVDGAPLEAVALEGHSSDGQVVPLTVRERAAAHGVDLPGGVASVEGRLDYGVMTRGGTEPFLLVYHPRAILGPPFAGANAQEAAAGPRLVPRGQPGAVQVALEADGRPVADADVTVILPDGTQRKVKTAADGRTPAFAAHGRYGAWARHVEHRAGTHDGKPYTSVRHYPTVVFTSDDPDAGAGPPADAARRVPAMRRPDPATLTRTSLLPPLPEASSSLGVAADDRFLYVYGGHVAPVHTYSTEAASGRFHRLAFSGQARAGVGWEELPGGPRLQGMNLAAHGAHIYRVGGMDPRNAPGAEADNHSVATVSRFDTASRSWTDLSPLPRPRSSHDVVSLGDRLYVVGGWNMLGADGGEEWLGTMEVLEPAAATPRWRSAPQPFKRRALIATAFKGRLWVIGGFTEDEEVSTRVDIFDPRSETWGRGPDLPVSGFNGFAPAACVFDGRLLVSVADGSLLQLDEQAGGWQTIARTSPRIVHRLVPAADGVVLVGGAAGKDNLDRVEHVRLR